MFYVYGAYNSKATDNVELVLSVCRKPYKIFILGEDYTVHQLLRLVPGTQHLPHVFDGLKYIGGVSDLFQYLEIDVSKKQQSEEKKVDSEGDA
jgi:hypothetical protein